MQRVERMRGNADIEADPSEAQNFIYGEFVQSEHLPAGGAESDRETGAVGGGDREPVAPRMAESREGTPANGGLHGVPKSAGGEGAGGVQPTGEQPPGEA